MDQGLLRKIAPPAVKNFSHANYGMIQLWSKRHQEARLYHVTAVLRKARARGMQ